MKRLSIMLTMSAFALGLAACTGDDGEDDTAANMDDTGDTGGEDGTTGEPMPPVTTTPAPTTITETAGDDSTGDDGEDAETDDDGSTGEPGDSTGGGIDYNFGDTPPDDLEQVDRMGMPAINTAVIASKDDYNGATPADDIAGDYVPEIVASLEFLHGALDDDLTGAGLVPCAVDDCVAQAAPIVVPDVLHIDPSAAAGFPNGRLPADPVIDVTLAVVLLDLSVDGQDALTLAGLPLNPPENDVALPSEFPFLADPN